ncbi:MAG: tryptophan--tRNA ligase [Bacilli bacterium]|nr:tryptophan--tRNA ligase [Bacilli bacterium]
MRILTGLKPTGNLTLGSYLGSIKQIVDMQDEGEIFLFIADLHALTIYQDPEELKSKIRDFISVYLACGVDPNKCTIYLQSENEYIPCISYLLECTTYYGEASRMIQFKEKSKGKDNFSVGLLTYPVLMAADILYCDTDIVPVGIDQKQHVELARNIAERFNSKYGETFKIPDCKISSTGTKIADLKDPTKKMSKSDENQTGVIDLLDDIDVVRSKIMKATTDSDNEIRFDMENKPGISNLLNIASAIKEVSIDSIIEECKDMNYGTFKSYVADIVCDRLTTIQNKYNEIKNSPELEKVLDKGISKSRELAKAKYEVMKKNMGIVR